MTYSVVVVDDEPMARANLVDALAKHDNWQVIQTFCSGAGLLQAVDEHQPDAVFLDIQMPGQDGLTLAKQLLTLSSPPLIVFVTAYSNYAVSAFELYAIDYLLKPFDDKRVSQCIGKLEAALGNNSVYREQINAQQAWAYKQAVSKLVVKSSANVRIIPVENIHWIADNGNYVDIHHSDGKHLLRDSLKHIALVLPKHDFIQVHRRFMVRRSMIRELCTVEDERLGVTLSNGQSIPVGKSFKADLVAAVFV